MNEEEFQRLKVQFYKHNTTTLACLCKECADFTAEQFERELAKHTE